VRGTALLAALPATLALAGCEFGPAVSLDSPWDPRNADGDADGDGVDNGEDECPAPAATVCGGRTWQCDGGTAGCGCCNGCPAGTRVPDGWSCIPQTGDSGFQMGSPDDELGRGGDQEALHTVRLGRSVLMAQTEVTQRQWRRLMRNDPSYFDDCGPHCPVEQVSWYAALAYCNALSKREGLAECYTLDDCMGTAGEGLSCEEVRLSGGLSCEGYRLPTEAEWERAARAGTETALFSGDLEDRDADPSMDGAGWYDGNSEDRPHPAGGKAVNPWGLYDVHGNVFEWVWDAYGEYEASAEDPLGPADGDKRVFRGGSWAKPAWACRSGSRSSGPPDERFVEVGFRVARSVVP